MYDSKFILIMCDEYTDISNKEQLSFCVRRVDNDLNAHKDFLGYYQITNILSNAIVEVIEGSLILMSLPISNLRNETFDRANNMLDHKSGFAKQIKEEQPKTLESHYNRDTLNLSLKEATKPINFLNYVIGTPT